MIFFAFSLLAFLVQGASVLFAFRAWFELERFNEELRAGLETHTSSSDDGTSATIKPTSNGHSISGTALEMHEALEEIFVSENPQARVLAMNELSTLADLVLDRSRMMRSSLPRIPLLCGAAAAIFVLSLGVFAEEAWPWAGLCVALGFISSLLVSIAGRGARRSSQRIRSLLEVLSRQLETRTREKPYQQPSVC